MLLEFRMRERNWLDGGRKGTRPEPQKPPPLAYKQRVKAAELSERQRLFEARFGR